jgi:hypothetical protein
MLAARCGGARSKVVDRDVCNDDLDVLPPTPAGYTVNPSEKKVYVKSDATGNHNGTSWDDAYTSLALDAAIADVNLLTTTMPTEIWLAANSSSSPYTLDSTSTNKILAGKEVRFLGGFNGDEKEKTDRPADSVSYITYATNADGSSLGAGVKLVLDRVTVSGAGPIKITSTGLLTLKKDTILKKNVIATSAVVTMEDNAMQMPSGQAPRPTRPSLLKSG